MKKQKTIKKILGIKLTEKIKFKKIFKTKRDKILFGVVIILLLANVFVIKYILFGSKKTCDDSVLKITNETLINNKIDPIFEFKYFNRLTGLGMFDGGDDLEIVAVMIDNHPKANPPSGINKASIVYEAPVEGGMTRFMAIYQKSFDVEKVGPVRSARPYFLDWLEEYDTPLYMHCGGSADGLKQIKSRNIFDADEFSRSKYYWRDYKRFAPHNLYTNSENWQKYFINYSGNRSFYDWQGWEFGLLNDNKNAESIKSFEVSYWPNVSVGWNYNLENNNYERMSNGATFLDSDDNIVIADNVIVQYTNVSVIDNVGRRKITTVGDGEVRIFRDGKMIKGNWKKESKTDRTRFFYEDDEEIKLKSGRTWLMIVPIKNRINISS